MKRSDAIIKIENTLLCTIISYLGLLLSRLISLVRKVITLSDVSINKFRQVARITPGEGRDPPGLGPVV